MDSSALASAYQGLSHLSTYPTRPLCITCTGHRCMCGSCAEKLVAKAEPNAVQPGIAARTSSGSGEQAQAASMVSQVPTVIRFIPRTQPTHCPTTNPERRMDMHMAHTHMHMRSCQIPCPHPRSPASHAALIITPITLVPAQADQSWQQRRSSAASDLLGLALGRETIAAEMNFAPALSHSVLTSDTPDQQTGSPLCPICRAPVSSAIYVFEC